ncbi:MAG: ROK family protein [Chloroflexi bacterium]|nr:ROK family protein [Chloroflexota bacterium]
MAPKTGGLIAAVDLGGTKILAALLDSNGRILYRDYRATQAQQGPEAVIGSLETAIRQVTLDKGVPTSRLLGIGLAVPGALDVARGIVTQSPNLPGWKDVPLKRILEERLGAAVVFENDANAAALGEYAFGAGRGALHMVYVTVSTGIGGSIIVHGQLYRGVNGSAGEIGHMIVDLHGPPCNCGNNGCLESLASGTALAREAKAHLADGESSLISELAATSEEGVTARTIFLAAQRGDSLANQLIRQAAEYLGVGLANVVNILNPEVIVIGGGVAQMGAFLVDPAVATMRKRALSLPAQTVKVVPGQLGEQAALLGMVKLVRAA